MQFVRLESGSETYGCGGWWQAAPMMKHLTDL
jgi:hypothetical protein